MTDTIPTLERLLHTCASALELLLFSPDLNLDDLERATRDAIEHAHAVLQTVRLHHEERGGAIRCVSCGEIIYGVQFTQEHNSTVVAYVHRFCALQAAQSRDTHSCHLCR